MKILIVDDDPQILKLLERFLQAKGREILTAGSGEEALEIFSKEAPDLVILDIIMPGMDGWEVLTKLRESSDVPVIMLTAKDSPGDTARGLLLGADDYISKPFDLGEVEARITAVMRRYGKPPEPPVREVGDLVIDNESKEVRLRGKPIKLSPKEYDLLRLLASHPGRVFSHDEIIKEVWRNKPFTSSTDVAKYIYLLREKVEEDPDNPKLIETVRGFGYKLAI
jgi:DNA-binding response OmpR family regulator